MTDEVNIPINIDFSNVGAPSPDIDEGFEPTIFTDFGSLRIAAQKKVTLFAEKQTITVPEIEVDGQPFTRNGMKEGHTSGDWKRNAIAYFVVHTGKNKDGDPFQTVRIFTNKANIPVTQTRLEDYPYSRTVDSYPENTIALTENQQKALDEKGTAWISDWGNLQLPALSHCPQKDLARKLGAGDPVWFKADNWNISGKYREDPEKTNAQGDPVRYYDRFWYNFTFYETEAEVDKARTEYWESRGDQDTSEATHYPDSWASDVQAMLDYGKTLLDQSDPELAESLGLTGDLTAMDGGEVLVADILAEIRGVPVPMIKLEG